MEVMQSLYLLIHRFHRLHSHFHPRHGILGTRLECSASASSDPWTRPQPSETAMAIGGKVHSALMHGNIPIICD